MGIYLGQLPPAEIARLKAELAETLIANFCYPRFFDHRTESLQMRPVDRTKRQEVWLYLSSVDFTAWGRIDLMTADFQHQIERLFIQFVQRNRNFFGEQGRRRMSDIRVQISARALAVAQGLRNHLTGQKQNTPPFGSPRPVVSWATLAISGRPEPTWEQISASTMMIQQQLQEVRSELRSPAMPAAPVTNNGRATAQPIASAYASSVNGTAVSSSNHGISRGGSSVSSPVYPATPGNARRPAALGASAPAASVNLANKPSSADQESASVVHQQAMIIPPVSPRPVQAAAEMKSSVPPVQSVPTGTSSVRQSTPVARRTETYLPPVEPHPAAVGGSVPTPAPTRSNGALITDVPLSDTASNPVVSAPAAANSTTSAVRRTAPPVPSAGAGPLPASTSTSGSRDVMSVGEDDIAIFEQLRHQLVVWLRIEVITAGLEISNQSPTQLLELLRQQARIDETRLQVVSTLLNLTNQVTKTGLVSVLDYKQALMFHLMHTRRH
jgi:hypothetical protein